MKQGKTAASLKGFLMAETLVVFLLLGVFFGALYDLFRFLRLVFSSKYSVFIIDFLYFVVISIVFFIFLLGYNNGQVRAYYFTLSLAGYLAYIFTAFRITLSPERRIALFIRKILKKCSKYFKKVLHFDGSVYYNNIMLRRKPLRKMKKVGNENERAFSKNKRK